MTTEAKPLDMTAWILIGIGILGIIASVLLRGYFYDAALKKDIQTLSYADGKVWIGLDDKLVSLDKENGLQLVSLASLGIKNDSIRQVIADKGSLILNSINGNVYSCISMNSVCQKVSSETDDAYNTLVALPNDSYLSINNLSAEIISHNIKTGSRIKQESYKIPELTDLNPVFAQVQKMDGFNATRLYRPNSGYVLDNKYIQSDTGNYRVVAWPLTNNKPDFNKPILMTETKNQPYNLGFVKSDDLNALIVLEGPSVLINGELARYTLGQSASDSVRSVIPLPLKDPTLMAQDPDNMIYVMEAKTGRMVTVKFLPTSLLEIVSEFRHPKLTNILQQNFALKSRYELFTKLAWGLFLLPVMMVLLLIYMGYNLNQKL